MAWHRIFSRIDAYIGRRHTARTLNDLSPAQRADIGMDRWEAARYLRPTIQLPPQRWLDGLR